MAGTTGALEGAHEGAVKDVGGGVPKLKAPVLLTCTGVAAGVFAGVAAGVPRGVPADVTDGVPFFGVLSAPLRCGVVRAVLVSRPCDTSLSRWEVASPGGDVALEELGRLSGPFLEGGVAEVPDTAPLIPLTELLLELGEPKCPETPGWRPTRTGLNLG